jgi:hypothetical protein
MTYANIFILLILGDVLQNFGYHNMKVDFNYVILDSAYDAFYIYRWISLLGGKPIIAINPRDS